MTKSAKTDKGVLPFKAPKRSGEDSLTFNIGNFYITIDNHTVNIAQVTNGVIVYESVNNTLTFSADVTSLGWTGNIVIVLDLEDVHNNIIYQAVFQPVNCPCGAQSNPVYSQIQVPSEYFSLTANGSGYSQGGQTWTHC